MSPKIHDLYEEYARGAMDRRQFLGRLRKAQRRSVQ